MRSYEAANRLVESKQLAEHNLKTFIPLHRILRTGIIRDVPQDYTIDMIKDSITSPIKVLDIHRLNRRVKIENEIKYLPSRTICVKFSGQLLPQFVYLSNCRYAVSPFVPKARICFSCFRVGHVSKSCKGKPRCLHCGETKHTSSDLCPRAQAPQACINCLGDHLATSHLCPHIVKHKMTLSLASTRNIPYSEAKKSVDFPSHSFSASPVSDPRFDFVNFPNTLNSKSSPLSFETPNRFFPLLGSDKGSSNLSPPPYSSTARKRPVLTNNNLSSTANSGKSSPRENSAPYPPRTRPSLSAPASFHPAHHNSLMFPNGRSPSISGNRVALLPNSISPSQHNPPSSLSSHLSLLNDIHLMRHISFLLPSLYEQPHNEHFLPSQAQTELSSDIPHLYPFSPSSFPPLSQPPHLSSFSQDPHFFS